jgi:2-keto-4-pentenoate hydratase/2-oxohepta-3-ene-1,7-dioic acid hydratase in catechol pathway
MKFLRTSTDATGLLVIPDPGEQFVLDIESNLEAFGAIDSGAAAAIAHALPGGARGSWETMIDTWDDCSQAFRRLEQAGRDRAPGIELHPLADVVLAAPLSGGQSRVFAVGANFAPHEAQAQAAINSQQVDIAAHEAAVVKAKREGLPPWGFPLLPGTFVGNAAAIVPPSSAQKVDYEAEVAVLFRCRGSRRGRDVVPWGVTAWNDLSIRDPHLGLGARIDHGPLTWAVQKNWDTSNSVGPWVVVDEGLDVGSLDFSMHINGELRQEGNTRDMVYSFDDVINHISEYLSIYSGDVVVSGTAPGTALEGGIDGPYLRDGDHMVISVEGVGELVNDVRLSASSASKVSAG